MKTRKIRSFSGDKKLVRERRRHIANKAVKVFLEKGYDRTTMRDLGKACGMSAGNLYNYIGSKEDILHLICVYTSEESKILRQLRSSLGDVSYAKVLCESMAHYFQQSDSRRELNLFFNREIHKFSREDRHILLGSMVDIFSFFEELLREGIETGEFQLSNPTLIAHNILMYAHDWALRKWFLKQHFTLEEYTKEQIRLVLELVATKTSQATKTGQAESAVQVSSNSNVGI